MGEENELADFLEKEVPDWKDGDFAWARFKAFSGQKQDWEETLNFWTDLIIKVARHLDLVVIDTLMVQQKWFIRDGVVPMGLQHVLLEMKKSGKLRTVEQVLGDRPSTVQWVGNILKTAVSRAGLWLLSDSYADIARPMEERLVVITVLEDVFSFKVKHAISVCQVMTKLSWVHLQGFKITVNEKPVTPVSENDHQILQLYWTMEMLQLRLSSLDGRISLATSSAIRSAKAGFRSEALRYVRSIKLLQLSREQCAGSMDKIDHIISIIADAETTEKVVEAIQLGTAAIKENHVGIEEVLHTLSQVEEATALQQEAEEALAETPISKSEVDDNAALDKELALLEEELDADETLPDVLKVPVALYDVQNPKTSQSNESDVETEFQKDFKKLTLESG